jgi:16S rRNA (guanine966-N2)-methyltransferase
VRITGGAARGIRLRVPARGQIRPATDRLRESVFSSLGPSVEGRRILDLFAGTGAYGLEALSRGAESVAFVEKDRDAVACLKANLMAVGKSLNRTGLRTDVTQADVLNWRPPAVREFDLVFADPPFSRLESIIEPLFRFLSLLPILGGDLRVVLEVPGHYEPESPGWILVRRIGKGRDQPTCCLFRRDAEG